MANGHHRHVAPEDLKALWEAERPYRGSCPETPEDYCDQNHSWSVEAMLWLLEADHNVRECCGTEVPGPPIVLTATGCTTWQDAWGELHDFGDAVLSYLKELEETVEACTGGKIRRARPVPKRRRLPSDEGRHRRVACRRARNYTRRFKKWGQQLTDVFNDHCHDAHPTHLSPPPDPPF
ncbi:MAG: hypothetical protein HKN72_12090 [Gemmatimonadetes bacterium]|nr:hypothetical protein [Gemmatimonadota bacterium]